MKNLIIILISAFALTACFPTHEQDQEVKDRRTAEQQMQQYSKRQPIPVFDWSLERELVIKLYGLRNQMVATHSVWRSALGTIEFDCPSLGFGLPYDTSLTNPLKIGYAEHNVGTAVIEQPEPNGVYSSKNTSATWVICAGPGGALEPHYVETRVTVFPYPVKVDYEKNRVYRASGKAVTITAKP